MDTRGVSQRQLAALLFVCLALAAWYVWQMPGAWNEWRVGVPDRFPGQHRGRVLGLLSGLALVLAIPLPLVLSRTPKAQRLRRGLLWTAWLGLMGVVVWSLAVRSAD